MNKKSNRIISIYNRLQNGETVRKSEEAERFNVTEKSIQRDLEVIRASFGRDTHSGTRVVYSQREQGYIMVKKGPNALTNSEVLTVCKILLESRSMVREEMMPIIDKLVNSCVPYNQLQKVSNLIANEKFHYLEPHHGRKYVEKMWKIATAVNEQRLMCIHYHKLKEADPVRRLIQPVGIMFSEYYFYLCAYICQREENPDFPKHPFPTTYRIDRIDDYEILEEHFTVPYAERFEEGEFRKRIQFMFGGELRKIKFRYTGISIEAVLDRLPTAEIVDRDEKGWTIEAEVYGDGVDMWLRSQGDRVETL